MEPHDVPMTVLGAGLLWFGWFGFNAGSALTAGGLAASAFIVTNIAAAAATITWVGASYLHKGKVSVVGAACGAVAGLVAITPASGFVTVGGALIIGLVAGGLCYSATLLRVRIKVDDALDVFAVHGVGGMFGAIATGIFATAADPGGLLRPDRRQPRQVGIQLVAVGATAGYAVVGTFVIVKVVDLDPRDARHVRPRKRPASTSPSTGRPPTRADPGGRPPAAVRRSAGRPAPTHRLAIPTTGRRRSLPARRPVVHPSPETRPWRRIPLYESRFEHDACGVGFVADAGGRSRDRVLPLALARARRARPSRGVRRRRRVERRRRASRSRSTVAPRAAGRAGRRGGRPGVVVVFLPRGRVAARRGRGARRDGVRRDRARPSAAGAPSRSTPTPWAPPRRHRCRRSPRRSSTRPSDAHGRPLTRTTPSSDAWSSPGDGSRPRSARAGPALAELSVPVGVVPDHRLQGPRHRGAAAASCSRTCARRCRCRLRGLPPALRDEHPPGLAPRPAVPLDRPQRRDQHRPRQPRAGPRPDRRPRRRRPIADELLAAGPLLSPDGSDSLSLDEALELLTATGWDLTPALLAAIPEALGAPSRAASARRDAPPPDRRVPRAVGRSGGHRVRRRASGSARWSIATGCARRRSRSRATGSWPSRPRPAPSRSTRRRRSAAAASGRASCCSSSPAAGRSSRTPMRRRASCARCRSTTPRGRSSRIAPTPRPPRPPHEAVPLPAPLRYLAGLDAERARLDIKTMALEAHEPLWSMGDDTPTPGRGRLDRPGRRPPPPGVRPGHEPGDRPGARADRDGPAGGARPAARAARRPAARPADAAAGATGGRGPRRAARRRRAMANRRVKRLDATWSAD